VSPVALAATPPKRGRIADIEHVVLLMQENRSFDHYYGTLSGVRGFNDPHALKLPNGRSVFHQPDPANPDGYLLPYRLDTRTTAAQAIPSMSHEWDVQHQAWNGGAMDNWLPAHMASDGSNGPYTMGYFTRDDLPFQDALADAFTICDSYHCSVLGPTGPNRHMWMAGTIDPNGDFGGPSLTTGAPNGQYSFKTYPERLRGRRELEGLPPAGFGDRPGRDPAHRAVLRRAARLAALRPGHGALAARPVRVRRAQRQAADGQLDPAPGRLR
jgi:phospholipase C